MTERSMSEAERAALQDYVNTEKDKLGLHNWEIEVTTEHVGDTSNDFAMINPEDCADIATVRFGPRFFSSPARKQRRIIAHELAHLHIYRASDFVNALKDYVAPDVWKMWFTEFERTEDVAIENLSKLFAPMMALPKLPRRSK